MQLYFSYRNNYFVTVADRHKVCFIFSKVFKKQHICKHYNHWWETSEVMTPNIPSRHTHPKGETQGSQPQQVSASDMGVGVCHHSLPEKQQAMRAPLLTCSALQGQSTWVWLGLTLCLSTCSSLLHTDSPQPHSVGRTYHTFKKNLTYIWGKTLIHT